MLEAKLVLSFADTTGKDVFLPLYEKYAKWFYGHKHVL